MKLIETKFFLIVKVISLLFLATNCIAQQMKDTTFVFPIKQPAYQPQKGPEIFIDEAHNNFHTKGGGFYAFSKLLEQDGYKVRAITETLKSHETLENCKILVIANPIHQSNVDNWVLPTPSAFTKDEISTLKNWVNSGGCLLLIADHMPFAGSAFDLAQAFGYEFINGFAFSGQNTWPPSLYSFNNHTLCKSEPTNGIFEWEHIDSVATFTGSAFKIPKGAISVLKFTKENYALQPDTAWNFNEKTPKIFLDGYFQGAISNFGKGKIAIFGEAAMFTAQIVNGNFKVGINSETAPQNAQFVLNLIHWLDGVHVYKGEISKEKKK